VIKIMEKLYQIIEQFQMQASNVFSQSETYMQIAIIFSIYLVAYTAANRIRKYASFLDAKSENEHHPIYVFLGKLGDLIFPLLAILMLRIASEVTPKTLPHDWIIQTALIVAVLLLFNSIVQELVKSNTICRIIKWIGMPILFLHLIGALSGLIVILQGISINIGNIEVSVYGVLRVAIFGSLLFWLGRASSSTGQDLIRRQQSLDFRTKEVAAKLLEVIITLIVFLLLLQVMGINLTALAVFGGALGVGLGFGLQAIASNFISGVIILVDKSISIEDYIELEDGRSGIVRELNLRSTTLETFDGKDIMVPNEKFIVESFTNWTHKNKKQRYRVDFSVAYHSDVRKLVEIIKGVVATHPQVLSGDDIPIEECPDCEIDGFGDSGINMFVEFWMMGIDDGKNRVGGDLMLLILEALQENGFEIPFPQREVRVINAPIV
jgi:small-conductance mechanosensitive channel